MRKESTELFAKNIFMNIWFAILFISLFTGCASISKNQPAELSEIAQTQTDDEWGIQIEAIRLSAGGYMLDFRYRVIDPGKAQALFDRKEKPYLIDQASGAKFIVPSPPKVGPLRTSNPPQSGRTYFILFANPGQYIKQGNKVTVVIGDFKVEDLTVN
jgi:hypothetical protein